MSVKELIFYKVLMLKNKVFNNFILNTLEINYIIIKTSTRNIQDRKRYKTQIK